MKKLKHTLQRHPERSKGSPVGFFIRPPARRWGIQNDKKGVSLIIAIIYVSAFLLVIAGLAEANLRTIRAIGNREMQGKAEYLSQSAVELAAYWGGAHNEGENTADILDPTERNKIFSPLYKAAKELGFANCEKEKCAEFEVYSRADATQKINALNTSWFSAPIKDTGDAAKDCTMNEKDPNFADDQCNWNRLYVGKSVDIPLYYKDNQGKIQILNGDFKLRMRAPLCKDLKQEPKAYCDINARLILYPNVTLLKDKPFRNFDKDAVLVQWIISDLNGTSSLVASDRADKRDSNLRSLTGQEQSTEISGGRVNDANPNTTPAFDLTNFVVLETKYEGKNLTEGKKSKKGFEIIKSFIQDIAVKNGKPVLHLSLVGQPRKIYDQEAGDISLELKGKELDNKDRDVPFLEYQLLAESPIADSKSNLRAWAELGAFRREITKEFKRAGTLGGFTLENL